MLTIQCCQVTTINKQMPCFPKIELVDVYKMQMISKFCCRSTFIMNSMKLVIPIHFISGIKTLNDAVTPQCQSQFTPKMKANAVPRLLSSLV